jgi:GNAT superfamily N-acetyltransferase
MAEETATNAGHMEKLTVKPLTPRYWKDFEKLFGPRGACGGCWCMLWRLKRSDFEQQKGDGNRAAMKRIVDAGETPGLLAYLNGEPIAWCAIAPRISYPVLDRSRVLKRIDDQAVWSISCLYVAKHLRRKGVSVELLKEAVQYVRMRGGSIVEGYPVEPKQDTMPDVFACTGIASAFIQAGFNEQLRRSETRPIMRCNVFA